MPYELRIAAVGHSAEDIHDVTFQAWQHDLGLGIAETGVEFDDLDPLRGLHQASVKHAFERAALGDHRVSGRLQHLLERIAFILGRNERQGRICAHTARIGPLVAVECPLVILRQHHRPYLMPGDEAHERKFRPREEILDDDLARAEFVVEQHVLQGGIGLLHRLGDHHALARGQPVVFQHGRQRTRSDIVHRRGIIGEGPVTGRRNGVFGHQVFGELLARLDTRGSLRRAESPQPGGLERIDHTRRQRHLGADDRKTDAVLRRKIAQPLHLRLADSHALGLRRNTRIAGGAKYLLHPGRARQRIHNCMFTATAANNQNFHTNTN